MQNYYITRKELAMCSICDECTADLLKITINVNALKSELLKYTIETYDGLSFKGWVGKLGYWS